MKRILYFVLMILLTGIMASAQEKAKEASAGKVGWLWEVSGNGLAEKSYLFGTCHGDSHDFTRQEMFGINGLENALGQVKTVLFEGGLNREGTKLDTATVDKLRKWLINPGPEWLMPEGTFYKPLFDSVAHFNEFNHFMTHRMKDVEYWKKNPLYWLSRLTFYQMFGMNRKKGKSLDELLKEEVLQRGIKVGYVEKGTEINNSIFSMFADTTGMDTFSLTLKEQAAILYKYVHALASADTVPSRINELSAIYLENDTCQMVSWLTGMGQVPGMEEDDPLKKKIAYDRNMAWMPVIKEHIASRPSMIAVGCRHLLGSKSLIAFLRREGYKVEPVK